MTKRTLRGTKLKRSRTSGFRARIKTSSGRRILKAIKEAEAKVNLARGEGEAQKILRDTLSPELLQKQVIDKWNGNLPLIFGESNTKLLDLNHLIQQNQQNQQNMR